MTFALLRAQMRSGSTVIEREFANAGPANGVSLVSD
jgi:hypothetical protein